MFQAEIVVLAAGVAAFVWLIDLARKAGRRDRFRDSLDQASRELGIRFGPSGSFSESATGGVDDFTIHVGPGPRATEVEDPERRRKLLVTAEGPRIPRGVSFAPETGSGNDVLTGDAVFDDLVEAHGEPSVVLSLLQKDIRQKVAVFVQSGGRLANGTLTLNSLLGSEWGIPAALRMVVALARALSSSEGGGICERLAHNARHDPHLSVRLWNLQLLQDGFAATPQAKEVSRAALSDVGPWVRLSAARFLVDEGREALLALVQEKGVPEQAAAEAVSLLAARLPIESSGPLLIGVLTSHSGDARRQAVEELGRLRHLPALLPLIALLKRSDPGTAAAAATALGRLGEVKAEQGLLEALRGEAHELRLAAARALGRVGSIRSVEPLSVLLERRLDSTSRRFIGEAIARIQSRQVGAEAGQLALATGEAQSGRLSLAAPVSGPGDLSLAPPRSRQQ